VGVVAGWAIQVGAVIPLAAALEKGRPLVGAWITGMACRAGALAVAGGLTLVGLVPRTAVAAAGIALVVLLLAEAGWLMVELGRLGRARPGQDAGEQPNRKRMAGTG